VFRIGGNTFYNRENKFLIKIPEFKRSGIGLIAEFCRISNGFPNQVAEVVGKAMGDVGEADEVDLVAAWMEVYPRRKSTKWQLSRLVIIHQKIMPSSPLGCIFLFSGRVFFL
jgi:hypothetical protein